MIRAAVLALPLVLAACLGGKTPHGVFRDNGAPIWSAAAFSPAQIVGDWQQVATFSDRPEGCRAGALRFMPEDGGLRVSGSLCLNGKVEKLRDRAEIIGPGRLTVAGQEWWVLWVDSGYRTLAIGTPSGQFGFLLDRGAIPPDRFAAAREVFDFNGYTTGSLRPF